MTSTWSAWPQIGVKMVSLVSLLITLLKRHANKADARQTEKQFLLGSHLRSWQPLKMCAVRILLPFITQVGAFKKERKEILWCRTTDNHHKDNKWLDSSLSLCSCFIASQNYRGWKGPLEITQSNSLQKQVPYSKSVPQGGIPTGFEYLQRRNLHNLSRQPVSVLHHSGSKEVLYCFTKFGSKVGKGGGNKSTISYQRNQRENGSSLKNVSEFKT